MFQTFGLSGQEAIKNSAWPAMPQPVARKLPVQAAIKKDAPWRVKH